jgi:hypothetical protein
MIVLAANNMKRFLITTTLLVGMAASAFAQEKNSPLNGVLTTKDLLSFISACSTEVDLNLFTNKGLNTVSFSWKDDDAIMDDLYIGKMPAKDELFNSNKDVFLKYYKKEVDVLLNNYATFTTLAFVKSGNDTIPFLGINIYDKTFNNLRTDEKERAKIVVETLLLPKAYDAFKYFKDTSFKGIGLGAMYLNKDFSDDSPFDHRESEFVVLFIDLKDIEDCIEEFSLTEDELLNKASVFMITDSGTRKVSLFK